MKPDSTRVIADLKEFKALTSDAQGGAQRVAWGPVWRTAREWFQKKLQAELEKRSEDMRKKLEQQNANGAAPAAGAPAPAPKP